MAIGLGIALYSRGNYDEAVKSLLRAADLSPSDPRCYYFLSKAYDSSPSQADEVIQRFARFSQLQPENGHASYYYAMSLWKGKRAQDPSLDRHQIESLLKKAVTLDPKLAEAHLQLGNLYSDQTQYAESIPEYAKALEINPNLADAHYRLGQAYVHTGRKGQSAGTIRGLSEAARATSGRSRQADRGYPPVRVLGERSIAGAAVSSSIEFGDRIGHS